MGCKWKICMEKESIPPRLLINAVVVMESHSLLTPAQDATVLTGGNGVPRGLMTVGMVAGGTLVGEGGGVQGPEPSSLLPLVCYKSHQMTVYFSNPPFAAPLWGEHPSKEGL